MVEASTAPWLEAWSSSELLHGFRFGLRIKVLCRVPRDSRALLMVFTDTEIQTRRTLCLFLGLQQKMLASMACVGEFLLDSVRPATLC